MSQTNGMDIRQRNYILQLLTDQQSILESQLGLLQANLEGIELSLRTLKGLDDDKEIQEQEVIVPLGPNAYTKAILTEPNKIMLYIKNDIVIEKTRKQAIESLEEMSKNNKNVQKKLSEQMGKIHEQLNQINQSMQQYQGPKDINS